jgi:uncharacterized protein YjeT (DUF2065 family)
MMVQLHNLFIFVTEVIRYGLAPWKWRRAWREVQQDHLAQARGF